LPKPRQWEHQRPTSAETVREEGATEGFTRWTEEGRESGKAPQRPELLTKTSNAVEGKLTDGPKKRKKNMLPERKPHKA